MKKGFLSLLLTCFVMMLVASSGFAAQIVGTDDIADGAVTGIKISDGAVTDAKISGIISSAKIDGSTLDVDTIDGKHATDFAETVHGHSTFDVNGLQAELDAKANAIDLDTKADSMHGHNTFDINGLQAELDAKADANHTHTNSGYANVVVVAKSGGDFTDPIAALSSITNASSSNPYLVKMMPGVYDIGPNPIHMKPYVKLEGSGPKTTSIISNTPCLNGLIYGATNSSVQSLGLNLNAESGGGCFGYVSAVWMKSDMHISDLDITAVSTNQVFGIHSSDSVRVTIDDVSIAVSANNASGIAEYNKSGPWHVSHVNIFVAGTHGYGYDSRYSSGTIINDLSSTLSECGGGAMVAYSSSLSCTDCTLIGEGSKSNDGLLKVGDGNVSLTSTHVKGTDSGINNASAAGEMLIRDSVIEGGYYSMRQNPSKIANSQLIGPFYGGPMVCYSVYDSYYTPITCQ